MAVRNRNPVAEKSAQTPVEKTKPAEKNSVLHLGVCIAGIYASFLTWAVLQERIATTPYGPDQRTFRASHAVSCVQSLLAFLIGYIFLNFKTKGQRSTPIFPQTTTLLGGYVLVAIGQTLSSPLTYASLKYVDFITLLLAKSCKLVPVMLVHSLLFRTKFPLYKYVVVALVTLGVSLFSIYQPSKKAKEAAESVLGATDQMWGFTLLGASLFLDGLYNTVQDQMFQKYKPTGEVTGPHMMVVLNAFTALMAVGGVSISGQLEEIVWFLRNHPLVYRDLVLYGLCGAVGQIFIFMTLERFGSLVLVTTTVTRKMISMLLSVVMFNHKLTTHQWMGVGLVFGGIAGEALYKQLCK